MTKVAVTGTTHCGKTMFLTSLLWQLEEFDETRFRLQEGVTLRGFHPLRVRKGEDAFPFKRFRNMLAEEYRWPEKTRDVYHYRCAFHRSDRWRIRGPQAVDFLDPPGERIADAAMVVHEDYGAWSDDLLDHPGQDPVGREVAAEFRDAAKPGAGARDVVLAYRLALARLIRAWKPLVSPSVFLLDRAGTLARDVDETALVASRRCGLDDAREFAPLPREVRNANPELGGEMRRHYREYRKKVVLPLFRDLMTASSLVVLVDIPSLLLAGDRRFVDERQVILDLLEAMRGDALGDRIPPLGSSDGCAASSDGRSWGALCRGSPLPASRTRESAAGPVLHRQSRHSGEVLLVVGDQHAVEAQRVGGDHGVVVAYRTSDSEQLRLETCELVRGGPVPGQHVAQATGERLDRLMVSRRVLRPFRAQSELGVGHGGDGQVRARAGVVLQDGDQAGITRANDVAADVGVQEIPHHNTTRPSSSIRSGRSAMKSSSTGGASLANEVHDLRAGTMIKASPSLRISTSLTPWN